MLSLFKNDNIQTGVNFNIAPNGIGLGEVAEPESK